MTADPTDEKARRHFSHIVKTNPSDLVGEVRTRLLNLLQGARKFGYISQTEYNEAMARIEAAQPSKVAAAASEGGASAPTAAAATSGVSPETTATTAGVAVANDPEATSPSRVSGGESAAVDAEVTPPTPSKTAVAVAQKLLLILDLGKWKKAAGQEVENIGVMVEKFDPNHRWLSIGKLALLQQISTLPSLQGEAIRQLYTTLGLQLDYVSQELGARVSHYKALATNIDDGAALHYFGYVEARDGTKTAFREEVKKYITALLKTAVGFDYISQAEYEAVMPKTAEVASGHEADSEGDSEIRASDPAAPATKVEHPSSSIDKSAAILLASSAMTFQPRPPVAATNKPSLIGSGTLTLISCGVTAMLVIGLDLTKPWQDVHNISQVTINQWELYILTFIALCISLYMTFNFVNDVKEQCCQSTAPAMPGA